MPRPSSSWRARVRWAVRHPRTALAVKAAVAATLAWLLALQLPGPAEDYPFYAPLGALTAMYPTVASSLRESVQSVASITLGALIALTVDALIGSGAFVVAVVVALGILVGGLRWLGAQRSYVPTAALFVLILGGQHEFEYAAAFAGLFLLGAAISVALNAAFPALLLPEADDALAELRGAIQDHLRHVADRIDPQHDDADEQELGTSDSLTMLTSRAREVVREADEATLGNRRARHAPGAVRTRWDAFRTLERVVLLVDDLYALLGDQPWGQDVRRAEDSMRSTFADGLDALADAIADVGVRPTAPEARAGVESAVEDLSELIRARGHELGEDHPEVLVMATIVTNLRRSVSLVSPTDDDDPAP